jgi:hypothetical protein
MIESSKLLLFQLLICQMSKDLIVTMAVEVRSSFNQYFAVTFPNGQPVCVTGSRPFEQFKVRTSGQCSVECQRRTSGQTCFGFNFLKEDMGCELFQPGLSGFEEANGCAFYKVCNSVSNFVFHSSTLSIGNMKMNILHYKFHVSRSSIAGVRAF